MVAQYFVFMCMPSDRDGFRNRGVIGQLESFLFMRWTLFDAKTSETTPTALSICVLRLVKRTSAVGVLSLEKLAIVCRGKQKAT